MGREESIIINLGDDKARSTLDARDARASAPPKTSAPQPQSAASSQSYCSPEMAEHLTYARKMATIGRRERQLARLSAKCDELRSFLGVEDSSSKSQLGPLLEKHAKIICNLEDKHRERLSQHTEKQNKLIESFRSELRQLANPRGAGSLVSTVAPTRPTPTLTHAKR